VQGIWDPDYDQTDINAVHESKSGDTVALGDDYGMVKILNYPSFSGKECAGYASYCGHSSHVTCVRFSHDDAYLISTGGADASIFQWKFRKDKRPALGNLTPKYTMESRSIALQQAKHSAPKRKSRKRMGRKPLPLSKWFAELDRRDKDRSILPIRKVATGHFGVFITKSGALRLGQLSPEEREPILKELSNDQIAAMLGMLPAEDEATVAFRNACMGEVGEAVAEAVRLNVTFNERYGLATATAETQPGVRVQLARAMSLLFAPTNFSLPYQAGAVPSADLCLDYIYGYNGNQGRHNVQVNASGEVCYHVAGTCVLMGADKTQRFFRGHNEDITCLAVHPKRKIFASGQRDPKGSETPYLCVWDSGTAAPTLLVQLYNHDRLVVAAAFSDDGKELVSIGADDNHLAFLWSWERDLVKAADIPRKPLSQTSTGKEEVLGCRFHPQNGKTLESEGGTGGSYVPGFVTYGEKVIKFYHRVTVGTNTALVKKAAIFGTESESNRLPRWVTCCEFTPAGDCVVGADNGIMYVFNFDGELKNKFEGHAAAVTALCRVRPEAPTGNDPAAECEERYVSGGDDGALIVWDAEWSRLGAKLSLATNEEVLKGSVAPIPPTAHSGSSPPPEGRARVSAIDCYGGRVVIGTCDNEVFEVAGLIEGDAATVSRIAGHHHTGELWGLDTHPTESIGATCGDDRLLRFWDLNSHAQIEGKAIALPYPARALCWDPAGRHIAVGFREGAFDADGEGCVPVMVFDYESLAPVADLKEGLSQENVSVLKYSPDGGVLAAGSWDQYIYLFDVENEYRLLFVLTGRLLL